MISILDFKIFQRKYFTILQFEFKMVKQRLSKAWEQDIVVCTYIHTYIASSLVSNIRTIRSVKKSGTKFCLIETRMNSTLATVRIQTIMTDEFKISKGLKQSWSQHFSIAGQYIIQKIKVETFRCKEEAAEIYTKLKFGYIYISTLKRKTLV